MKHYPPAFTADAVALYASRPGVTIRRPLLTGKLNGQMGMAK